MAKKEVNESVTVLPWHTDSTAKPMCNPTQVPQKLPDLGVYFNQIGCLSERRNHETHCQVRIGSNDPFQDEIEKTSNGGMFFWCDGKDAGLCKRSLDKSANL